MKHPVALLVLVALPVWAIAQTTPAPAPTTPATKSTTTPPTAPGTKVPAGPKATAGTKTAPGAKAAATTKAPAAKGAADKSAKKDEPPPKIEGMEIARGAKGFLGLQVIEGNFKLSFYDAKKKPVAPDVIRAVLRWNPNYKPGAEIYVLGPGDGKSLTVAKTVRPPYQFKLFVSMFAEGVDDPTETFVVDFSQ